MHLYNAMNIYATVHSVDANLKFENSFFISFILIWSDDKEFLSIQ